MRLINKSLATFIKLEILSKKQAIILFAQKLILISKNLKNGKKRYPGVRVMWFDLVISMMTCINFGEGLRIQ